MFDYDVDHYFIIIIIITIIIIKDKMSIYSSWPLWLISQAKGLI